MQKALLFFTIERNYVHLVLVEEIESDHGLFKDRNKYVLSKLWSRLVF